MERRLPLLALLLGTSLSFGASVRTPNFIVEAPTPQIAQQIGQYAEKYRREKALQWLGLEMPPWPEPCPLKVTITPGGSGGATSFGFGQGQVLGQQMHIEGTLERLLASVLPHEVTHTVFAFHFRQPLPRWADEGGSVLSEDNLERRRHDRMARQFINGGRSFPLRRLFAMKEYPGDVMVLYAQGFSVTEFLVSRSNRQVFLNFVRDGMARGWDFSAKTHYGFANVEALEAGWIDYLRKPRPAPVVASRPVPEGKERGRQVLVRQTVPPRQPLDEPATTYRGASPSSDEGGSRPFRSTGWDSPGGPASVPPPPPRARLGAPVAILGAPQFPASSPRP
jgi:hypothetical protein